MMDDQSSDRHINQLRQVFVLLGASNLTLGWGALVNALKPRFRERSVICVAHGMGRSYVNSSSRFGIRRLPGILNCGLWDHLPHVTDDIRVYALITDLGNDLLYGRSVEDITTAAAGVVDRLKSWAPQCSVVITRPPVESVQNLSPVRFRIARKILFPQARLSLAQAKEYTTLLDEQLMATAARLQVPTIRPPAHWYGFDPIHVKAVHRQTAFAAMFEKWPDSPELEASPPHDVSRLQRRPVPETRWILGTLKKTIQPCRTSQLVDVYAY